MPNKGKKPMDMGVDPMAPGKLLEKYERKLGKRIKKITISWEAGATTTKVEWVDNDKKPQSGSLGDFIAAIAAMEEPSEEDLVNRHVSRMKERLSKDSKADTLAKAKEEEKALSIEDQKILKLSNKNWKKRQIDESSAAAKAAE